MLQIKPNVSPLLREMEKGCSLLPTDTWQDNFSSYERHFIARSQMKHCIWVISATAKHLIKNSSNSTNRVWEINQRTKERELRVQEGTAKGSRETTQEGRR